MTRAVQRLTPGKVQKTTKPGMYADGAGLYLRVGPNGSKSWVYRYTDGKLASGGQRLRDMGLGALHTIGLAEARERARQQRVLRLDGANPIDARRHEKDAARVAEAKATTFRQCAERYIASHQAAWKSHKSLTAWEHTLNAFAYPIIGGLPVAAVDTDLVMKVLEPIWTRTPETASRLRGRLEAVLNYAHVKGQRACENPARWKGQLDQLLPARQKVAKTIHHPALPYAELSAFMADLRQQGGTAARALEFTILTAARTGEVIGARWDEIDLEARLWVVPGSRMKSGAGAPRTAPRRRYGGPGCIAGRSVRPCVYSQEAAPERHGNAHAVAPHGAGRSYGAWVPVDLLRLDRGEDQRAD